MSFDLIVPMMNQHKNEKIKKALGNLRQNIIYIYIYIYI